MSIQDIENDFPLGSKVKLSYYYLDKYPKNLSENSLMEGIVVDHYMPGILNILRGGLFPDDFDLVEVNWDVGFSCRMFVDDIILVK